MIKKVSRLIIIPVLVIITVAIIIIIEYIKKDYIEIFRKSKGSIVDVKEKLILVDDTATLSELYLKDDKNREYQYYIRKPLVNSNEVIPGLILLGGMVTGKDVIKLVAEIKEIDRVILASMEYPYRGKKKFKNGLELLIHYPEIKAALFNTIPGIMYIIDYLYRDSKLDREKLYLVGASFGAFFTIIAGAVDERIRAVISCYGGGNIGYLMSYNLNYKPEIINKLLGGFGALLIAPFEPLKYVNKISPRPFLMINGKSDEQIPLKSVMELYEKAGEPKEIIWLETKHLRPTRNKLTLELTYVVANWMKKNGLIN
ncbi:hypothetical protein DRQ09_00025 [candidate division KSB1 bacterium]|nr:MAG: hypothetical protein DRQ09_00025 [candidate division KSB1 bacterium]